MKDLAAGLRDSLSLILKEFLAATGGTTFFVVLAVPVFFLKAIANAPVCVASSNAAPHSTAPIPRIVIGFLGIVGTAQAPINLPYDCGNVAQQTNCWKIPKFAVVAPRIVICAGCN